MKLRMLRNTFIAGELVLAGEVIDADGNLALMLLNSRKAQPYVEAVEQAVERPTETATVGPSKTGDLTHVSGIGPSTRRQLAKMGIYTLQDLAAADPEHVAQLRGVSTAQAQRMIEEAKRLCG